MTLELAFRQEDTWTEVARRALQLFATALRVKTADASGGLDNWVGMPRHSDSHPLNCMDFATVLQVVSHVCYQRWLTSNPGNLLWQSTEMWHRVHVVCRME